MRAISFQPWHLAELELGAEERVQYARAGTDMFGALSKWHGPAWSLVGDHGRIVGCVGMLAVRRDGVLWAVLSDEARANRFGLHRTALRLLERAERLVAADRILAAVRSSFDPGRRWLIRLGFTLQCDFQVSNERYERYVKWAHLKQ